VVANVLLFFALVMSDLMPLPAFGVKVHDKIAHKNLWTVILFGAASGLVIGSCTAPILGTLLIYIASKHNIIHGVSLMFVFSYGVGASLILVGTFSGILGNLPKSGVWLIRVKQFCGLVLIIAAEYFLVKAGMLMF
jgi:thiol:disulfide interchange protein DsbD